MLRPITQKMTDESEGGIYRFTFYCDNCGAPRQSEAYQSISEEALSPEKREIEHNDAYERANHAAMSWFNRCPGCKRYVCDYCYRVLDNMDLCDECAAHLTKQDSLLARSHH